MDNVISREVGFARRIPRELGPYVAIGFALTLLMIGHTVTRHWAIPDFWMNLGAVREFSLRPVDPSHPLLVGTDADPYLGPYALILGLISLSFDLAPVDVLGAAGLVNLGLLLLGLWCFVRRFSIQPLAPTFALLFLLLAWGWSPWRWSGYFNLNSIGSVLPLSSTFATAVGLLGLSFLADWLQTARKSSLFSFAVSLPLAAVSHPMTGLWICLLGLGVAIGLTRKFVFENPWIVLSIAGSAMAMLLWPFYPVWELLAEADALDETNRAIYANVLVRAVLAAPGLILLGMRAQKNWRDPLSTAAILVGSVFVLGWVTERWSFGRVFPGLILIAHVAMADWFAARLKQTRSKRQRRLVAGFLAMILAIGAAGTAPGWIRGIPHQLLPNSLAQDQRLQSRITPFLVFADVFDDDDSVVASEAVSLAIGANAAKVISVTVPEPFVASAEERREDSESILDPATPPHVRHQLLAKYEVEWLVLDVETAPLLIAQIPEAVVIGPVAGYEVVRVADSPVP